jgi:hypothetical protein
MITTPTKYGKGGRFLIIIGSQYNFQSSGPYSLKIIINIYCETTFSQILPNGIQYNVHV